jgi:hypothetical protein
MKGFWKLVSLLVSCAGFLVTCGLLLYRGETFLGAALRATIVFVLLGIVQNFLGSILGSAFGLEPEAETRKASKKGQEPPSEAQDAPSESQ